MYFYFACPKKSRALKSTKRGLISYIRDYVQNLQFLRRLKAPGGEPTADESTRIQDLQTDMSDIKARLADMQTELPVQNNGIYLSIILGSNLNLSLMNKNDRYRYKEEYEKFKMTVTNVILVTLFFTYLFHTRAMDAIAHFMMVWFYCTLTIRESVLRINGSRIKGWWVIHHYASCVLCGITLTWKDGACYQEFRPQFLLFCTYIGLVQLMQCQYQRGCLRRLHSLGQRHSMDITVEGFSSWMFKGLTFLLPFLIAGYLFQFYNAFTLIQIWRYNDCTGQWQVFALALLFLIIGLGNSMTTLSVLLRKFRDQGTYSSRRRLVTKYSNRPNDDKDE